MFLKQKLILYPDVFPIFRYFPGCRLGDRCLYVHPLCKFDARCLKKDCPFSHLSRPAIGKPVTKPAVQSVARSVVQVVRPTPPAAPRLRSTFSKKYVVTGPQRPPKEKLD